MRGLKPGLKKISHALKAKDNWKKAERRREKYGNKHKKINRNSNKEKTQLHIQTDNFSAPRII